MTLKKGVEKKKGLENLHYFLNTSVYTQSSVNNKKLLSASRVLMGDIYLSCG